MVLYGQDEDYYFIKDSTHDATPHGQRKLKIRKKQLTHKSFCENDHERSRFIRRNSKRLSDKNFLLSDFGLLMKFEQK